MNIQAARIFENNYVTEGRLKTAFDSLFDDTEA